MLEKLEKSFLFKQLTLVCINFGYKLELKE